jgi:hypothetical protein
VRTRPFTEAYAPSTNWSARQAHVSSFTTPPYVAQQRPSLVVALVQTLAEA